MLPLVDVHVAITSALTRAAAAVEAEQAVRGIDALDELALHAVVAEGLRSAGYGVCREVRYPGDRASTRRSDGRRCDLVVTVDGLPLEEDGSQQNLFQPAKTCRLADALWIEVKVVAQFLEQRPNRSYGAALQGPIWRDFQKLAADSGVVHAAQLVILFTSDEETAAHDLSATVQRAWNRGLRVDAAHVGHVAIGDRYGSACCTAALVRMVP